MLTKFLFEPTCLFILHNSTYLYYKKLFVGIEEIMGTVGNEVGFIYDLQIFIVVDYTHTWFDRLYVCITYIF